MRAVIAKLLAAALFVILAAGSMAGTRVAMIGDSPEADSAADAALAALVDAPNGSDRKTHISTLR